MDGTGIILITAAAGTGLVHTLIGPDHYLPFIMMSRARRWSVARTLAITVACGVGHVLSSVVLGIVGVAAGWALLTFEGIEGLRGQIAAWAMVAFGIVYALWGLWRIRTGRKHTHAHAHGPDDAHAHDHAHVEDHSHAHVDPARPANITPWVLFVIFVMGPCEILIPQVMYPASQANVGLLVMVTVAFGVATIVTMTAVVAAGVMGLRQVRFAFAEKYAHVIAGGIIAASGLAVQFLGL